MSETMKLTEEMAMTIFHSIHLTIVKDCPDIKLFTQWWEENKHKYGEPKTGNPMPEILPGYVITNSSDEELTIVRHDPDGYLYYWHHSNLYSLHDSHVKTIREHHGVTIWSKGV